MNLCVFIGRLVQDVVVKEVGGSKVANFPLAVSRNFKKKDGSNEKDTDFLDFEIWDSGAETFAKYLSKGDPIMVQCSAKQETWEQTLDDGTKTKRSRVRFRIEKFEFISSKPKQNNDNVETTKKEVKSEAESNSEAEIPF